MKEAEEEDRLQNYDYRFEKQNLSLLLYLLQEHVASLRLSVLLKSLLLISVVFDLEIAVAVGKMHFRLSVPRPHRFSVTKALTPSGMHCQISVATGLRNLSFWIGTRRSLKCYWRLVGMNRGGDEEGGAVLIGHRKWRHKDNEILLDKQLWWLYLIIFAVSNNNYKKSKPKNH